MNLLQRGRSMMNRLAPAANGVTGVYTRRTSAGGGSFTLTDFTVGNADYVRQPAPGEVTARHDFQTRTLNGPAASLAINGTVFVPDVGDRWTETINGTSYTFEVAETENERAVTWSNDRTRVRIRLKIKAVG